MKFKASIDHHIGRWNAAKRQTDEEKVSTEVEDTDAGSFKKKVESYLIYGSMPCSVTNVRKCSIDGIAVGRMEFLNTLQNEIKRHRSQMLKSAPPIQYLGLSDLHASLCRLRQVGNEILVGNPPKEDEFYEKMDEFYVKNSLSDNKMMTLYHGTVAANVGNILLNGFKVSSGGALGRGLYVGPYDKAMGFNGKGHSKTGGKGSWAYSAKKSIYGYIFELEVLLGKCHNAMGAGKEFPKDCDSVYYSGFRHPEYCLKEASQALIKKLIIIT